MAWTDPKTWLANDPLPATELNQYVRDNLRYLHDKGADITASGGLLTAAVQFHNVTGGGTVDNIAMLTAGTRLILHFASPTTLRHNAASTGNLRLTGGSDHGYATDDLTQLISDGAVWWELGGGPRVIRGRVNADGTTGYGTGFAPSRTGTGIYVVVYAAAFAVEPVVVVTAAGVSGGGSVRDAHLLASGTGATQFTVELANATATPLDAPFNFIATAT